MSTSATHSDRMPVEYSSAQAAQRALVEMRRAGEIPDLLWLLEHPRTITWGSSGGRNHLLLGEETLRARGIALCPTERGGDVTFHEPGQLIGYLIVDIGGASDRDLHAYLRAVEQGLIEVLRGLGIAGLRDPGRTGVWIDGSPRRKIAAMGVRVKSWVTSHGFALNIENALEGFGFIVPCGIADAGVTSVAREVGRENVPSWDECLRGAHAALEASLGRKLRLVVGSDGLTLAGGRGQLFNQLTA